MFSITSISFADSGTYTLDVEDKTFDVAYNLDGEVLAMDVDQESTSLLIGITNAEDSVLEVGFSSVLLSANDGEFIVLVDGLETDYTATYEGENPTLSIPIEAGTEEVEIIGTSVIPEFPFSAIAVMGAVSAMILVLSRTRLFK
jgi:hypothetical protein